MDNPLKPLTPLGADTPQSVTIGSVTIAETTETALASLATRRGRQADVAAASASLGLTLPGPGQATISPLWSAFWLGSEQWMLMAPQETHEDNAAHLETIFTGAASITEQTDGWVRFEVEGAAVQAVFQRLCALDTGAMAIPGATRTVIEHLGVQILRLAGESYVVLGPRSSAASLHHALTTAARSVL